MSNQTSEGDEWFSTLVLCKFMHYNTLYKLHKRDRERVSKHDHGDNNACRPMSLCFREGPEAGTGKCLGKITKKWSLLIVFLL